MMKLDVYGAYVASARAILAANLPGEGPNSTKAACDWIKAVAEGSDDQPSAAVMRGFSVPTSDWQVHWNNKIYGDLQFNLSRLCYALACVIVSGDAEELPKEIASYALKFAQARTVAFDRLMRGL